MKKYEVVVSKTAQKELLKLPSLVIKKIIPALQSLSENPRPVGCKKLKGFDNLWRMRVGNYRAIYAIDDTILLVDIQAVGHRKDIYV
ncbi:MAG: type II toxin-antitoxin system RelE/ParE family toxin [Chitinophagaceae bacterium]|nr:type II toxin-antitoxin system RelE/ParE family toxin [Chitinophagaceae bacterium]